MLHIRKLEDLCTNEELINYFAEKGIKITEEEIETLKKSYEQAQENSNNLTLKQLDSIAGGVLIFFKGLLNKPNLSEITVSRVRRNQGEHKPTTLVNCFSWFRFWFSSRFNSYS